MTIIDVASSYIGVHESTPAGRALIDEYNKLVAGPYGAYHMSYSEPWCAAFASLCGVKAGIPRFPASASCSGMRDLAIKNGYKVDMTPEVGALVLFDWGDGGLLDHVGIVERFDTSTIYTIEGNTSDMVARRTHSRFNGTIKGYIHFGTVASTASAPSVAKSTTPDISYGAEGPWVVAMQALLIANGYTCGSYGADGEYGPATKTALLSFQRAKGLSADGVCGAKTWSKLVGV